MKKTLIHATAALALCACNSVEIIDGPIAPEQSGKWRRVDVEVLDYSPAPGQFVNVIPAYTDGDDAAAMRRKVQDALNAGREVTLGAWGGSVTLRLTEPIERTRSGSFRVCGNAILSGVDAAGLEYGSSEPGIVEVMSDDNGNGLPDDTWYELKGLRHSESEAGVTVTYHAPAEDFTAEEYIAWAASDGTSGWLPFLKAFHNQPYFPQWADAAALTFSGRRLPDNGVYNASTGRYDLYCLQGYADTYPDDNEKSVLELSSAIDTDGKFVRLERVDFVRVTTGVLQVNGTLGECSTEISGIEVPEIP